MRVGDALRYDYTVELDDAVGEYALEEQEEEFAVIAPLEFLSTDTGYSNAHKRVNVVLGKASAHKCTECGKRASHWAYDHKDRKEGTGTDHGAKRPYSDDPKHYKAYCISCHKKNDLAHIAGSAVEEFLNRNHTPTSAHPNPVGDVPRGGPAVAGAFLDAHRDDVVYAEGQNDFPSLASPAFKTALEERRRAFVGGDDYFDLDNDFDRQRSEAVELIKRWTGGENEISIVRGHPQDWAKATEFLKAAAVPIPVTIRRAVDFDRQLQVGDRIPNRMIASFTSAGQEPHGYNTRIVIRAGDVHAVPISWLSNTPLEREWLVMSDLEVVSVTAGPSKPTVIIVKEVAQ